MINYQIAWDKLTNRQLKKSAAKNKTGTVLRINKKKKIQDEEVQHELLLTVGETTKIRNVFANNMSTDKKLSKAKIFKIVQSVGYFVYWLGSLEKKVLTNIAIPLAIDNLAGLVSNLASNVINQVGRNIRGKRSSQSRKSIYFIYFEQRYEWYHQNYRIKCISWWYWWNSETWNTKT